MIDAMDRQLLIALNRGLPLEERPYLALGEALGLAEEEVLERLAKLQDEGVLKRLGAVVRHRELGYRANAMVVWDIPDARVPEVAGAFCGQSYVTLCYRRPRVAGRWRFNLFCMIHGKDRHVVLQQVQALAGLVGLGPDDYEVLFSKKRFKQCGPGGRDLHQNAPIPSLAVAQE